MPYVRGGSGPRHAVILLGASSLFRLLNESEGARYSRLFSRLLPPGYRFTILGYAEHPPEGHALDWIAADVADFLTSRPKRTTVVIGISFGGFVAMHLAAEYPELVQRLVLLVSAHRFSDAGRQRMDEQIRLLQNDDLYGLIVANVALFRRPWMNWLMRFGVRLQLDTLKARLYDPQAIARSYARLFSDDLDALSQDVRRIRAETLVVGGTADQFFDQEAFEETAGLIPNCRLALVPHETHMLPLENGSSVARAFAAFLAEKSPVGLAAGGAR
jgi:pimeloyl-ACP methyl ester carboxylesterase